MKWPCLRPRLRTDTSPPSKRGRWSYSLHQTQRTRRSLQGHAGRIAKPLCGAKMKTRDATSVFAFEEMPLASPEHGAFESAQKQRREPLAIPRCPNRRIRSCWRVPQRLEHRTRGPKSHPPKIARFSKGRRLTTASAQAGLLPNHICTLYSRWAVSRVIEAAASVRQAVCLRYLPVRGHDQQGERTI
jgi:hypothetical protein